VTWIFGMHVAGGGVSEAVEEYFAHTTTHHMLQSQVTWVDSMMVI